MTARPIVVSWLRRSLGVLLSLVVLDYLVLPQLAGTERAIRLLRGVDPALLTLGIALEAASLVSYSLLTRSVLPDGPQPFSRILRADLTGLGVAHLLPGGGATATAVRFRLLHRDGAASEDAAVGLAVEAVLETSVLAGLLWACLLVSIPFSGPSPLYVSCALVGAGLLVAGLLALLAHDRHDRAGHDVVRRLLARVPARLRPRLTRAAELGSGQARQLLADRRGLRAAAGWTAANWVLDAASLWVFLAAYGHLVNPVGLLVAYSLANLVATLPISPGGLGLVEGVLIPSLVGLGTPQAVAVLGTVTWRLFQFWFPIPVAGVAYLSLLPRRTLPAERS